MSTDTKAIALDQFISAPPSEVWAAITDPELLAKWWAPGDMLQSRGTSS